MPRPFTKMLVKGCNPDGMRIIGLVLLGTVMATNSSPNLSDYGPLIQYGVLGIVVAALLTGRIHTGREYDQMKQDRDDARTELATSRQKMEDTIIPAMIHMNEVLEVLAHEGRIKRQGGR